MRWAAVGAVSLVAATIAGASIPAPRERPPTLEEAANEVAGYRADWTPYPRNNLHWEVIFAGTISSYEVTSLPT